MEKYSYSHELREKYHIDELNSLTLTSRIDGFLDACNINLENSICTKELSPAYVPYISKINEEEGYSINFVRGHNEYGNYFTVVGKYNDLSLFFMIYYDKDKKKNKINNLPYRISLRKEEDGYTYIFNIETIDGVNISFSYKKYQGKELIGEVSDTNYGTVFDPVLLCNVRIFTLRPGSLYNDFAKAVEEKRDILSKRQEKEEKKDNFVKKYVKKIKMMINND